MKKKRALLPYMLMVSAGIAALLGFVGTLQTVYQTEPKTEFLTALHTAILTTLQLFVLNVPASDMSNWLVRVSGVLAPLTTAGATLAAFRTELLLRWRMARLRFRPPTHLYLGGGRAASAIYTTGRSKAGRHVGVDLNEDSHLAEALLRRPGDGFVLQGDATSEDRLSSFPLDRIPTVWVATGDDKRNLEALEALVKIRDRSPAVCESRWFVDVASRDLTRLAPKLVKEPPKVEIEFFSIETLVSRYLMQDFHRKRFPQALTAGESARIHVCVMGSGRLAEALILQSLQQLVTSEDSQRCLTLTWFGPDAENRLLQLYQRMPFLDPSCPKGSPWEPFLPIARLEAFDTDEGEVSLLHWEECQRALPFSAVYVAGRDQFDSLRGMNRAVALRDAVPIAGQMITTVNWDSDEQSPSRHNLQSHTESLEFQGVIRLHALTQIIQGSENYPGEHMDDHAKAIHRLFKPEEPWELTVQTNRWSSRMAADHLLVKKALLPHLMNPETNGVLAELDDIVVDLLARLEHRRFVVERLVEGWIPMTKKSTDRPPSGLDYRGQRERLRLSESLLPFDELPESERDKNRHSIRRTFPLLLDQS